MKEIVCRLCSQASAARAALSSSDRATRCECSEARGNPEIRADSRGVRSRAMIPMAFVFVAVGFDYRLSSPFAAAAIFSGGFSA
jgi:hypothetical protein